MEQDWAFTPQAGWDEYRRARARFFARLAELSLLARLEAAWAAPAAVRPAPEGDAGTSRRA
jgi:hypothetical protein